MLTRLVFFLSILSAGCALQGQVLVDEVHETYDGIENLDVKGAFCTVEIIGENRDDVSFDGEITGTNANSRFRIHHEKQGDKLKVWVESPAMSWTNAQGKLTFAVPADMNVFVDNASGRVSVSNLKYGGLIVQSASGSISIKNTASNARAGAASGSVQVEGHEGDLEANSSSGSLKLMSVRGNISASTASGSIRIEESEGDIAASAASGSVHLSGANGAINIKTASGSIHGSEVMLTGPSSFHSASGSIHMELLNDMEELGYNLSSGSGSISVNGEKKSKRYIKETGKIMVKASAASGSLSFQGRRSL